MSKSGFLESLPVETIIFMGVFNTSVFFLASRVIDRYFKLNWEAELIGKIWRFFCKSGVWER
ncbi:hypothetical protein CF386_12615 (plasmid) [Paraphotobacterium marinum]|uniref:Uncharacterized protein n=1 Tax=Paraphotobacterium marinum TaxID=1755811 RepID=A0A220VI79_9GAMM|nr:hypothetical protein CF386_12615 [Paraphotobacterium marinum]